MLIFSNSIFPPKNFSIFQNLLSGLSYKMLDIIQQECKEMEQNYTQANVNG